MSYSININKWITFLSSLAKKNMVYAPFSIKNFKDYKIISDNAGEIVYHSAKPLTPLKHFFFLLKECVSAIAAQKKVVIIGAKNCDLTGLNLIDKVFLDEDYPEINYQVRRDNTIIIGSDCHDLDPTCHCTAYGIAPYPEKNCDIILNVMDNNIILQVVSKKGEDFFEQIKKNITDIKTADRNILRKIDKKRLEIKNKLKRMTKGLPNYQQTAKLISRSIDRKDKIWKKYAETCISCGACVISCPTCHCFLLIDKPSGKKMIKLRTQDACQYPGFEQVAAGVDPLQKHYTRFRNRYICKYINRFEKYNELACTGCGRCTDTCIGKIDKNKVIRALK